MKEKSLTINGLPVDLIKKFMKKQNKIKKKRAYIKSTLTRKVHPRIPQAIPGKQLQLQDRVQLHPFGQGKARALLHSLRLRLRVIPGDSQHHHSPRSQPLFLLRTGRNSCSIANGSWRSSFCRRKSMWIWLICRDSGTRGGCPWICPWTSTLRIWWASFEWFGRKIKICLFFSTGTRLVLWFVSIFWPWIGKRAETQFNPSKANINGLIMTNPTFHMPMDRRMNYLKKLFITKIIGVLFGDFFVNSFLNPTSMFSPKRVHKIVNLNSFCKFFG